MRTSVKMLRPAPPLPPNPLGLPPPPAPPAPAAACLALAAACCACFVASFSVETILRLAAAKALSSKTTLIFHSLAVRSVSFFSIFVN
ncbi:MAG: hypothetical protein DA330_09610 [Nitrososphaera sp.]|nr:hypothetical protein [Nitrososphaera sp.]